MNEYTPGPWRVDPTYSQFTVWVGEGRGHGIIANLSPEAHVLLGHQRSWEKRKDEVAANARLIAAAPDLLAACERAVAWLRRIEVEYPGSVNQDAIDKHIMPAIAKAKEGAA